MSFQFGTSYYPELTRENEWKSDLQKMRDTGMCVIRMLDFAWSSIEPREGVYTFEWLDRFLDLCSEMELKVVMCTPTAAPPQWLMGQYPEMMVERRNGDKLVYGERRACCVNNTIYRDFSVKLAAVLGKRYGHHPAVLCWQIDNELIGPEFCEFFECHCPDCTWQFRQWLKKRYETVEEINAKWGLGFWSMEFTAWGEIPTPRCHRACYGHTLDFHRFYSDSQVEYIKLQYAALRANICDEQYITHNSTGVFDRGIDHRDYARALDCIGWDAYPGAAAAGHGHQASGTSFAHDFFRCAKNMPFWVLETNPNIAPSSAYFADAYARGCVGALFWLWRPHRANLERGSRAFTDFNGDFYEGRKENLLRTQSKLEELATFMLPNGLSSKVEKASCAFIFNPDNVRNEHREKNRPMPYLEGVMSAYHSLWNHGVATDVSYPGDILDGYRLAVMPAVRLMTAEQADTIRTFVENGGVLAATARTAHYDEFSVFYRRLGEPMLDVLGVRIRPESSENLSPHVKSALSGGVAGAVVVTCDGQRFDVEKTVVEWIEPHADCTVLATFEGGALDGKPAAILHPLGKGKVYYSALQKCEPLNNWLFARAAAEVDLTWYENDSPDLGLLPLADGKGLLVTNHGDKDSCFAGETVEALAFKVINA